MTTVTVLSIRQPYIDEILSGDKKVENRGGLYPWSYRGRVYLHASGMHPTLPTGVILGHVDIVDCVESDVLHDLAIATRDTRNFSKQPKRFQDAVEQLKAENPDVWNRLQEWKRTDRDCQLRHISGPWCYLLENPIRLHTPISAKGMLGLWRFNLPD